MTERASIKKKIVKLLNESSGGKKWNPKEIHSKLSRLGGKLSSYMSAIFQLHAKGVLESEKSDSGNVYWLADAANKDTDEQCGKPSSALVFKEIDYLNKAEFMTALVDAKNKLESATKLSIALGLEPRRVQAWLYGKMPYYREMQELYPKMKQIAEASEDEAVRLFHVGKRARARWKKKD